MQRYRGRTNCLAARYLTSSHSDQLTHAFGHISIEWLNHKVIVVSHQAEGIIHPPHVSTHVTESLEKAFSAPLVQVNICPPITTRRDMLHPKSRCSRFVHMTPGTHQTRAGA